MEKKEKEKKKGKMKKKILYPNLSPGVDGSKCTQKIQQAGGA